MRTYGKVTLIVTRILLLAVGAALGFIAMMAILNAHPELAPKPYSYVYECGTAVLVGLILLLSAKSVLWLVFTIGDGIKNLFRGKKPTDVAGVLIGLAVGGTLTYLFDFLLSLSLDIISLRVILDVVFAVVAAGLGVFAALKAFRIPSRAEKSDDGVRQDKEEGGYLLTSSALACEGIEAFVSDWLLGEIFVTESTVTSLIELEKGRDEALAAYKSLIDCGRACTVPFGGENEKEANEKCALAHNLRIIAAGAGEYGESKARVLGYRDISKYAEGGQSD